MSNVGHFSQLDEQTQTDLIAWYNVVPEQVDDEDKALLLELFNNGQFEAWHCPKCGERCYNGQPENWDNFQGVDNVDHCSYPSVRDETAKWCDDCRCYHQ